MYFVFAFRYTVPDRHAFFLPFYCLSAMFIGLGADWLINKYHSRTVIIGIAILTLLPIPTYFLTPELAREYYKPLAQRRQRPYRDEYTYWLQPWKTGYRGAERFAVEALNSVEQDAVIYAYTTDIHALLYVQEVLGKRPDIKIVSDHDSSQNTLPLSQAEIETLIKGVPVYVTSPTKGYCPTYLLENFDFSKQGLLYQATAKNTAQTISENNI
jgi:hypothetical protein